MLSLSCFKEEFLVVNITQYLRITIFWCNSISHIRFAPVTHGLDNRG